tara:strand:+ start:842 stop:1630 length:789 start_codon:yes stop_codon:yes gene_type:complete
METAVCLTGYVRTFGVPGVYQSIEAVRRSLRAPLFAVVSNDDGDTFKGQAHAVNDTALAAARAHVHNIRDWRVVSGADQFVKLAYCATMVEAHERRRRVTFGWVVRLRPDGLYRPVPPGWLDSLNRTTVYQSSNSGDVMWVMPRHTLGTMAAIAGTPEATSPEGDNCCGDLPHRYFECACEIVRTSTASAAIAHLGLVPTSNLGNRRDNPTKKQWIDALSTERQAHQPGTGKGVTAEGLHRLPSAPFVRAYTLLNRKPWAAG